MAEQFKFVIPHEVEEDDFIDYFKENMDEYSRALDHSAYAHDDRSQVDDMEISDIYIDSHSVTLYYDVDISAYHGCRDVNYADTDQRHVVASRKGRVFTFDVFVYPERRSTLDEF